MKRSWRHVLFALATASGAMLTPSAHAKDPAAEARARLAAERAAAQARYVERERACAKRFVVTACVEDARSERRETLSRLRSEQNELDDAARKARAAARSELIRERLSERQDATEAVPERRGEPAKPLPRPRSERSRPAEERDDLAGSRPLRPPSVPQAARRAPPPAEPRAARLERESRSRTTFDAAQREAEAHRLEVEQRNARRSATRKPAVPLPAPAQAPVPAPPPPP